LEEILNWGKAIREKAGLTIGYDEKVG